ncbi:hypothetical protein ACFRH6_14530 [Streptomyces sp. NPDC056749]|uniref:hypothetical protein n=1 Tax=Streptomyces sp. NPDC056749 TaxID=3345936 RepID=UPI0036899886
MSGPLTKYRYRGTVLKLNDTDAARLGLTDADVVGAPEPAAADEPVGGPEAVQQPAEVKARAGSSNKARTAAASKGGRRATPAAVPEAALIPDAGQDGTDGGSDQGDGAADSGGDGGPGGGD